jgi:hypothetical protein
VKPGNYPETTRHNYLLAAAQLARYLAEHALTRKHPMRRRSTAPVPLEKSSLRVTRRIGTRR